MSNNPPWLDIGEDGPVLLGTIVFAAIMMTAIWIGFAPEPVECDPVYPECHESLDERDRERLTPGKVIATYAVIRSATGVL